MSDIVLDYSGEELNNAIRDFKANYKNTSDGNITKEGVLAGQVGYNAEGKVVGEMPDNGAVDKSIDGITETSYTIPKGYHNGEGSVKLTDDIANEVDSQTDIISQIKSALQGKAVGDKQEQSKELNVTENGSYVVKPDEGFTLSGVDVNVDVPKGDPYEVINSILNNTIAEFYTLEKFAYSAQEYGYIFNGCSKLVKWAMPNNIKSLGSYVFRYCSKLKYIDIGKPENCQDRLFYGRTLKGMTVIIRAETPPTLSGAFLGSGFDDTTKIFVPKASLDAYKTATNWSTYADCYYAIEDYPEEVNYDNY